MRWLVRLVTPPGGKVLDFFAGSGSNDRRGGRGLIMRRELVALNGRPGILKPWQSV